MKSIFGTTIACCTGVKLRIFLAGLNQGMKEIIWALVLAVSVFAMEARASVVNEAGGDGFSSGHITAGFKGAGDAVAVTFPIAADEMQAIDYFANAARVPATLESMTRVLQLAGDKRRAYSQGPDYLGNTDELKAKPRVTSLPEPSVWLLLVTGLVALVLSRRRSRSST
jgi:hypothetical protein